MLGAIRRQVNVRRHGMCFGILISTRGVILTLRRIQREADRHSALTRVSLAAMPRLALVRVELLLDDRLRPCLLASRLMLRLELHFAELADSDDRNILDPFHDPKIALGHEHSLPQFAR
jgi:hypothetical protein